MRIHLLLEGHLEEPLAVKLVRHCGHLPGTVYGKHGCSYIRQKARDFVPMAGGKCGVLVLTDFMDARNQRTHRNQCPPEARHDYLGRHRLSVPRTFLLRFAVNELESWIMADREGIAAFLRISAAKVPRAPDDEADPKRTLVALARGSRDIRLRDALVPKPDHGGAVGPGYTPAMWDFVETRWSPERARANSPSLARCIARLRELHELDG